MVAIIFVQHDGTKHHVDAESGKSVMLAARENNVPGILADCGGQCSCSTCHVFVEPEWYEKTGGPNAVEEEVMDISVERRETSRLSCQITVSADLDGLVVQLPEEQLI